MKNLTELSLNHKPLVWYFIVVIFIGGIFSYFQLGRMEDPKFTIRQMIVAAYWAGATADEVQAQIWLVKDGKVTLKNVETKDFENNSVRVRGLSQGDVVVTAGVNKLRDGQEVRLYR